MPTLDWLKKEFSYGYDSGNVTSWLPNRTRKLEERRIGGSYRQVFREAIVPRLSSDSHVMELGPGRGSWSRAILSQITQGRLTTVDFQDVTEWLDPTDYAGRLECHRVFDNSFRCIEDDSIDFFWSMGVLCHNNQDQITEILRNALPKMKVGGYACHQFSDWKKLDTFGWQRGGVPESFRDQPDDEIWWPRNSTAEMCELARQTGWQVKTPDLGLLSRDGLILLKR